MFKSRRNLLVCFLTQLVCPYIPPLTVTEFFQIHSESGKTLTGPWRYNRCEFLKGRKQIQGEKKSWLDNIHIKLEQNTKMQLAKNRKFVHALLSLTRFTDPKACRYSPVCGANFSSGRMGGTLADTHYLEIS